MTQNEAKAAVAKYGSQAAAARALSMPRSTFQEALKGKTMKSLDVGQAPATAACDAKTGLRGFAVGTATRCAIKKPTATVVSRFYLLKKGVAYKLNDAAREWVMSEETIKRHAQDRDCFRYVETTNENWEACIMHPETAKQYPVK
jgi:hypothetical protein